MSTTRADLIKRLAAEASIRRQEAEQVLDVVLGAIGDALSRGDRVELRGFGCFGVRHRAAREMRNPRTGHPIFVAEKGQVYFKAGGKFAGLLNDELAARSAVQARQEAKLSRRDKRNGQLRLL